MLNRALDIGCAVGRSTFELAREYDEVIGIDYSKAFVSTCEELRRNGQAEYSMILEGDLTERKIAVVDPAIVSMCEFQCMCTCMCWRCVYGCGFTCGGQCIK